MKALTKQPTYVNFSWNVLQHMLNDLCQAHYGKSVS